MPVDHIAELTALHEPLVAAFDCGDDDLNAFLRDDALRLQERNAVRTYVAMLDGAIVGYVSLMTDAVVLETKERKRLLLTSADHPVVPALKVARLGVASTGQRGGLGTFLMRFAAATAYDVADRVGCRLLTVDAYPASVRFYEWLGFVRNRAKAYKRRDHPSMRLDLFGRDVPGWITGD